MSSTRVSRHVNAPRAIVYRALLDERAVATWKVPTGMTSHVHAFDAREGGSFRISLTYDAPIGTGKTTAHTDTYHGRFVKLVPNEQVVEVCTTVYRPACRPATTRSAGGRRSRSSRPSSRRARTRSGYCMSRRAVNVPISDLTPHRASADALSKPIFW